jgi:hypothetical protein
MNKSFKDVQLIKILNISGPALRTQKPKKCLPSPPERTQALENMTFLHFGLSGTGSRTQWTSTGQ